MIELLLTFHKKKNVKRGQGKGDGRVGCGKGHCCGFRGRTHGNQ